MNEDEIPVGRAKNLKGKTFGDLIVLYRVNNIGKQTAWKCKCKCGNIITITAANLHKQRSCAQCSRQKMGKEKIINLKNQKFNKLTVLELVSNNGRAKWKCQCDCGNIVVVESSKLRNGHTQSCGCLQKERASMANGAYLIGQKFGFLTVLEQVESKNNQRYWKCQCDCGNITIVKTNDLTMKKTQSCGCKHESLGVYYIKSLLNEANISFTTEQTFDTCRFKTTNKLARFDFYIQNNYLLEFDGEQHFRETNRWFTIDGVERDAYKNQWCKDNNIPLIRIPYTKLDTLCIEDLLLETTQFRVV